MVLYRQDGICIYRNVGMRGLDSSGAEAAWLVLKEVLH
jgi:hypothetical protein